jgi:hypothetical protein
MLAQLIHDPERYVAKTLDQAIQKLARLNEYTRANDSWGQNIYLASKDLEEKYQSDFIRYLANPASFRPTKGSDEIERAVSRELPKNGQNVVDPNYVQTYTLTRNKNGRDFGVLVTNGVPSEDEHDEKVPELSSSEFNNKLTI